MALSKDLRQRIIRACQNREESLREIAKRFMVSLSTVWLLWKQFRTTGSLEPKPHGGGAPAKLDVADYLILEAAVRHRPGVQEVAELREFLRRTTGKEVSLGTISRALHRLGFTHKKRMLHASERDQKPAVQLAREAFQREQPQLPPEHLYFVDEVGVNLGWERQYGWAPSGERAGGAEPMNAGPQVSVVGALGLQGLSVVLRVIGAVNGPILKTFLKEGLAPQLGAGDVVFMDNVRFHKVAGIQESVADKQATVRYLPVYSPEYSPLELCWSKLKQFLRTKAPRTLEDLQAALTEAVENITKKDI
jgi:transposase